MDDADAVKMMELAFTWMDNETELLPQGYIIQGGKSGRKCGLGVGAYN